MKKALKFLDENLEKCIATVLIMCMSAIIFLEFCFRYFHVQAPWTEELARYMFVWMVYLGCSAAIKLRKHLKIDAVQLLFNDKINFCLDIISNVIFFIFCVFLIVCGWDVVYKIGFVQHQESPAMHLPMIIPYLSWWVCSFIMCFRLVQDTIKRFQERKEVVAAKKLEEGKEA